MQTHQDVWFSVGNEEEHVYFRGYHLPYPILDFIPWPIRVAGVVFPDGSEMFTAGGGGSVPSFLAGNGITITSGVGTITISTNAGAQTPWLSNINGAGFSLTNVANLTVTGAIGTSTLSANSVNATGLINANGGYYVNNVPFASFDTGTGGIDLNNISSIDGQPYPPSGGGGGAGFGNFTAHDVTSSRLTSTIYTNNTGVGMLVQFTLEVFVVATLTVYVDGNAVTFDEVDNTGAGIVVMSFLVPVPNGSTYEFLYDDGGSGTVAAQHWIEWW